MKHDEEVWIQAEIVTSTEKEIIVKTADDPNGRVVLGPNEPIFLRLSAAPWGRRVGRQDLGRLHLGGLVGLGRPHAAHAPARARGA